MGSGDRRGFTLLELLVVTAIIGIIASIAISQYRDFIGRGYDSSVASTVRNVATGEEAYFATHRVYAADVAALDGMVIEDDIVITISAGNSGSLASSFRIQGSHPLASHSYTWISDPEPGEPNFIIS